MRSYLCRRTRDVKLLLDDDASVTTIVVVRASRTGNHRIHWYSVSLAVDLLCQRALRFQRDIPQVLPEFSQLLEPSRRAFGGIRGAGFFGNGVVRVGRAVLLPRLENLRNDHR